MNIITETRLRTKYKGFFRPVSDISEITIHGTGSLKGESYAGLIAWMSSDACERKPFYKQGIGLFPYEIDVDGTIHEMMPPENWYYHSDCGIHDSHTVCIEMINISKTGTRDNSGEYTEAQYKALFELIEHLCSIFPITDIHSHDANRRMFSNMPAKPCPGAAFSWSKLEEYITENIDRTMMIIRG